ncbi:putative quinol monooxygenase [Brevundimonas sp. M20]|uniref:putative quinol monooxygenase n=1 Tax=Brevundimonas sp. M20 TaxID=2591463 RepID=UPI001146304F|nr:putative quinol monooxygenase [Brevundimonas sp. M20]QDH73913.1 antibiotic biosynthesis monooxygenase [Brevundimonas sp. M20]
MYGLIGRMTARAGQREALTAILLDRVALGMPGCLSYVVSHDPADPEAIRVSEVWINEAAHRDALADEAVKTLLRRGLPLIATFEDATVTTPVGGLGLG